MDKVAEAAVEMEVVKTRTKLNYQYYVTELMNENGIENVYASLSAKFNDYIYSFLQDICNKSVENDLTIIQVFKYLPNEIKILVYLTNIIVDDEMVEKLRKEEEERKARPETAAMEVEAKPDPTMFYSKKYGTQMAMSNVIYNIIPDDTQKRGKMRGIQEMEGIYGIITDIVRELTIKEIHIFVILFFGTVTKYYINEENKYELEITKYINFDIPISNEVKQLVESLGDFPNMDPIYKLRVLIQIYFVGVTHPKVRSGGANKTRKKSKSSQLRKTIKKRIPKKIKRKSLRRKKPIKKWVNSKNRKVKRKIKNKTRKYKKPKKQKRSRKPKPKS